MYYSEMGWDIGGAFIMLTAGALAWAGLNLRLILVFSIIGALVQICLVRRYYKKAAL